MIVKDCVMAQAWDHLLVRGAEVRHKQGRLVYHHICGRRSSHCNEESVLGPLSTGAAGQQHINILMEGLRW